MVLIMKHGIQKSITLFQSSMALVILKINTATKRIYGNDSGYVKNTNP